MQAIPDLQENQLREMIEKRKEEAGGLLTDEGAAHIVAYELGVVLKREEEFDTEIHIKDLTLGMNDVSISGRVLLLGSTRSFTREDGSEGKVTKLLLGDSTGVVDIVIWDEKADTLREEEIEPNEMIRIFHGYVKEGLNGEPELNIGKRGSLHKIPDRASDSYPRVEDYFRKIGDIKCETRFLNLEGKVRQIYPLSEFKHSDGTKGKVQRILLSDDTGEILCVFWNDKVDSVGGAAVGDLIRVTAASAKKSREEIEVHTTRFSEVAIIKTNEVRGESKGTAISEIRPGMTNVDVHAWIVQIGTTRHFRTKEGNEGDVVTLLLADKTGIIRLNLWNDRVREASNIKIGDFVSVKNAYARAWLGTMSLNLGSKGEIRVSERRGDLKEIPKLAYQYNKIAELEEEQSFVSVRGTISKRPEVKSVVTDRRSEVKVATFSLKDNTGEIDVTLWGGLADLVEKMDLGTEIDIRGVQVDIRGGAKRLKSNVLTTVNVLKRHPKV